MLKCGNSDQVGELQFQFCGAGPRNAATGWAIISGMFEIYTQMRLGAQATMVYDTIHSLNRKYQIQTLNVILGGGMTMTTNTG